MSDDGGRGVGRVEARNRGMEEDGVIVLLVILCASFIGLLLDLFVKGPS